MAGQTYRWGGPSPQSGLDHTGRMRPVRRLLTAAATALLTLGVATPASHAAASACPAVFSASFAADLARRYPGMEVTAAVYDTASGCWHHLHPGARLTTASVVKAQVLGALLLQAQDQRRVLTAWERSQAIPMIRYSFNPETSALYGHVGSVSGMQASDARFGVTATTHTATFGLTRSTAADRTRVALRLLWGGGGLHQAGRDAAWDLLTDVHPLQQWGITAGVPHGWTVGLKNGFYPSTGLGWRVGSSGFVRRHDSDQGYALTVMTEQVPDQATGIRLVEEVSRRAAAALTVGPGAARPIDRARCVRTSSSESWAGVTARLGLPTSRAGEVRATSGGNPSPLAGQQACSPSIPPEPPRSTSAVNGRYVPVAADLDCDGADDLVWYGPRAWPDVLWTAADRGFRSSPLTIRGDYVPVPGDFDGDGCGDVLWYGAGGRADSVWYGGASTTSVAVSVAGSGYHPVSGDYDGDARTDILWYRPGGGADHLWFGAPGRGAFSSRPVTVNGVYTPVAGDFAGDGADDLLWYAPGSGGEYLWSGTPGSRVLHSRPAPAVSGRYRPVAADIDADGADELIWYGPGRAFDARWDGAPGAHVQSALAVSGDYLPVVGDLDGDGPDDLAWYGPGTLTDWIWWGGAGGVSSSPLRR